MKRPVTDLTLDCDKLLEELALDAENQGSLYLSGVKEDFKERLLQQSNCFLGLEALILPKDHRSGIPKKYCFLSKSMPLNMALREEIRERGRVR